MSTCRNMHMITPFLLQLYEPSKSCLSIFHPWVSPPGLDLDPFSQDSPGSDLHPLPMAATRLFPSYTTPIMHASTFSLLSCVGLALLASSALAQSLTPPATPVGGCKVFSLLLPSMSTKVTNLHTLRNTTATSFFYQSQVSPFACDSDNLSP